MKQVSAYRIDGRLRTASGVRIVALQRDRLETRQGAALALQLGEGVFHGEEVGEEPLTLGFELHVDAGDAFVVQFHLIVNRPQAAGERAVGRIGQAFEQFGNVDADEITPSSSVSVSLNVNRSRTESKSASIALDSLSASRLSFAPLPTRMPICDKAVN